ncbi:MAG: arylsulfotransferase (ASST), partial [Planctomycetota bacterium]
MVAPIGDSSAYLIDGDKQVVHTWKCGGGAGNSTYLLPNGVLLRTGKAQSSRFNARGGSGGVVKMIAPNNALLWEYQVSDENYHSHHDVEALPNGNVLVIAWEYHSAEEAIDHGRDPSTLAGDA